MPLNGGMPEHLLDAADRALYQFKRNHRARLVHAETPGPRNRGPAERVAAATN
jgi:hypothetical protein